MLTFLSLNWRTVPASLTETTPKPRHRTSAIADCRRMEFIAVTPECGGGKLRHCAEGQMGAVVCPGAGDPETHDARLSIRPRKRDATLLCNMKRVTLWAP